MATVPQPTRADESAPQNRWIARPWLGRLLRILVWLAPVVLSVLVFVLGARFLSADRLGIHPLLWWLLASLVATAILVGTDRLARKLLPLAALLSIALVFPDQAPSRFGAALRSGTPSKLSKRNPPTSQALMGLVRSISHHDRATRGHSERVRSYAQLIGQELGLSPSELDRLSWAALLHDVGKLQVPPAILNKDGRPDETEWDVLRQHPAHAAAYLQGLEHWLGDYGRAASEHHERWDGDGYPAGLAGEQIHLASRVVSVADSYDVMTSARSYKKPMPTEAARQEIARNAGTQFDPAIVRAFLNVGIGKVGTKWGALAWVTQIPDLLARAPGAAVAAVVAVAAFAGLIDPGTSDVEPTREPVELAAPQPTATPTPTPTLADADTDGVAVEAEDANGSNEALDDSANAGAGSTGAGAGAGGTGAGDAGNGDAGDGGSGDDSVGDDEDEDAAQQQLADDETNEQPASTDETDDEDAGSDTATASGDADDTDQDSDVADQARATSDPSATVVPAPAPAAPPLAVDNGPAATPTATSGTPTPAPTPTLNPTVAALFNLPTAPASSFGPAPTPSRPRQGPPSVAVTPVPTATPTPKPTATPTPEPTATPTPTATPEPTATPTPTATPEPTATPTPTATPEPTATPTPTATPAAAPATAYQHGSFNQSQSGIEAELAIGVYGPTELALLGLDNQISSFRIPQGTTVEACVDTKTFTSADECEVYTRNIPSIGVFNDRISWLEVR